MPPPSFSLLNTLTSFRFFFMYVFILSGSLILFSSFFEKGKIGFLPVGMMKKERARMTVLLLLLGLFLVSCQSMHPQSRPTPLKILVVDFEADAEILSQPKKVEGWWFSSRDVYNNSSVCEIFADIFARQMKEIIPSVEVYSRVDFKYYSANMKDRLKKNYPRLNNKSLDYLFSRVSPCDLARDLNLDLVLSAKLNKCYTTHNRAIHWWSSVIDVDVALLDAESGFPEWKAHRDSRKYFLSQYSSMEKVAESLIKQMKKEYFY